MGRIRIGSMVLVLAVVAAACGDDDEGTAEVEATDAPTTAAPVVTDPPVTDPPPTTAAPETTTTVEDAPPAEEGEASTTSTSTTEPPEPEVPDEPVERTDLLTFARGTTFVSQTGLASGSAGTALRSIDGDPYRIGLAGDDQLPVSFVYQLPADTTFDRFAVPDVLEWPGNVTFVENVVVSGSLEGPDAGYQELASFTLETHEEEGQVTEIVPDVQTPVRWVKVDFDGGILIEPDEVGNTGIRFSELIGNGTQDAQPLSTAFDGVWALKLTERTDLDGLPMALRQDGATISGCVGTINLTGSVNGVIARANGIDTRNDKVSSFIFVADEEGGIEAVWSENLGLFKAWTAVEDPEVTSAPCSEEPPPEGFPCGAIVYVNFDRESAVLRPESDPVLADVFDGLTEQGVTAVAIDGHTSTEGTDEYNQGLSEARAQAVVDDLVARGYDPAALTATGFGETMPIISPDDDESSREINRRVEIGCG